MQIPLLNGTYTDENGDIRTAYPRNLVPVPKGTGLSRGYLRPAEGIVSLGSGPGLSRGGINWRGKCYRVMGSKFVREDADGTIITISEVGSASSQVTLDYSFDYLGVCANGEFWLYDGSSPLVKVGDFDLKNPIDFIWVDGYFLLTDGTFLMVTDLNDPFSINPVKYGSSEADPDPILAVVKVRNEPHVLNRYTIEVFDNIGGSGFPFGRVDGAQIQKGVVGTHMCCEFENAVAFVGSGRNESLAVWLAAGGNEVKISSQEIDLILEQYTEEALSTQTIQAKISKSHKHLYINLPNRTLVYDAAASRDVDEPVWFELCTSLVLTSPAQYRAKDFVYCYNRWLCADTTTAHVGYLTNTVASHWGLKVAWEFRTTIIYNEGKGAIVNEMELAVLTGRAALNVSPTVYTSYSVDGELFSTEQSQSAGTQGDRNQRLIWFGQGFFQHWRVQKFRGVSDSMLTIARLEIQFDPLTV